MRLACPNCGAQYEVPAEAIPASGRDVQCSACGHTWFEAGAAADEAADEASGWAGPPAGVPRVEDDDEEADDLAEAARPDATPGPAAGASPDVAAAAALPPPPPRSTVTPEVAEILRAEAEREARARGAERLERPPGEGGAAPTASANPERERAEEARRRMARLRGEPAAASVPAAAAPAAAPAALDAAPAAGRPPAVAPAADLPAAPPDAPREAGPTRRDRLPDIEEINSSLRGTPEPSLVPPVAPPPSPRSRFPLGFGGVLLAAAALALLYAYGSRIASALPASRVVLDPYVAAIDEGRLWLDLRLQGLLRAVDGEGAAPDATTGPSAPVLPAAPSSDAPPAVLPEDPTAPRPGEGETTQTLTVPVTEPVTEPASGSAPD